LELFAHLIAGSHAIRCVMTYKGNYSDHCNCSLVVRQDGSANHRWWSTVITVRWRRTSRRTSVSG